MQSNEVAMTILKALIERGYITSKKDQDYVDTVCEAYQKIYQTVTTDIKVR